MSLPSWVAGANPRRTAVRACGLIAAAYLTFTYVLLPVRGVGVSMQPTIDDGDLVFINRLTYRMRPPRRGEIVAVRLAGPSVVYVKRLIALPGDRIAIVGGALHVNDEAVSEPYVVHRHDWQLGTTTLGPDEYFVVGDNRGMPMAQHEMGTTSRGRLIGPKVF